MDKTKEELRLEENSKKKVPLEKWGPYLSERQWGTVREDYSANGEAWPYFPFDQSAAKTYRWGEDGICGISDFHQTLCFAPAFWNGQDPVLKERLFGLSNPEGNHGEDVKELYYFLDNTPTHSYMKALYKYPQAAFPYRALREINAVRSKKEDEFEILDTGVFDQNAYFDIYVSYAKNNPEDILIDITCINRGKTRAKLCLVPTLWFRNDWQFNADIPKPEIQNFTDHSVVAKHQILGEYWFYFEQCERPLFTENESNNAELYGEGTETLKAKDAFHKLIIRNSQRKENVSKGTKFAPVIYPEMEAGESKSYRYRLSHKPLKSPFDQEFAKIFDSRIKEANDFYDKLNSKNPLITRQALAGLLWSKQYYNYDIEVWLNGDFNEPPPPEIRKNGRNSIWTHLKNADILMMPDTWEYPWYASWDLAFQCIPMAMIDPVFAKHQLLLVTKEWYMSPDGQIPAYEWDFSDLNPPIHAWAGLKVYEIEKMMCGIGDINFLKRLFQKLLINFTWWLNREDLNGNSIFTGGFMGLDNISVIDRSSKLEQGIQLEQADATAWMGLFAVNMLEMALEIAQVDDTYQDMIVRFYEHFVLISQALNNKGLWDPNDHFFYDLLRKNSGEEQLLKVRSVVGLVSMFAVNILKKDDFLKNTEFLKSIEWFKNYRQRHHQMHGIEQLNTKGDLMFSMLSKEKLQYLISYILDDNEFLSDFGLRALSRYYFNNPYQVVIEGKNYSIDYEPGESTNNLFGGNSNWRGPVWMPVNYLIIKSIKKYHEFYDDDFTVEFPKNSGKNINLGEIVKILTDRLIRIFELEKNGERVVFGKYKAFYAQPENQELILFHEYFHGEDGHGLGASHQTGWTSLIAELIADIL